MSPLLTNRMLVCLIFRLRLQNEERVRFLERNWSAEKFHTTNTEKAKSALIRDNIDQNNIFVTGNTVVDALLLVVNDLRSKKIMFNNKFSFINKKFVLITGHRRESFGKQFEEICKAIKDLAKKFESVNFVYSVHLNPNVQEPVKKFLSHSENIFLIPPHPRKIFSKPTAHQKYFLSPLHPN